VTAIRFGGMASGLPPNIVDQLMEAERIPVKNIQAQKGKSEEKLKLVNDLETKVSEINKSITELVGIKGFNAQKLTSGDPNIVNGEIDPDTVIPGNWNVEVIQLAQKPSAISNGFPDKDTTQIGVGYFSFETPEGKKEVYISKNNSTLEGVAKAINSANVGMRASVISDRKDKDNPYKLIISGLKSGDSEQINFPKLYLLDGDQDMYFEESRPSSNGKIKVDGFEVDVDDNKVSDLIPGVTLDLRQAAPGRGINITVSENNEIISGKVKVFVDAYNGALSFIQNQNKLSEKTDTSKTLGGDGMLRTIENNLRRIIINPQMGISGSVTRLSELGISFTRAGTLDLNMDKFNGMLAKKSMDVQQFLRGDGFKTGFVTSLKRELANLTSGVFGPLALRKQGLQSKIKQADERIDKIERNLVRKEEALRRKFSDLETKMSQLKTQGASVGNIGSSAVAAPS
jgi:flagellar hook-associated protein 2